MTIIILISKLCCVKNCIAFQQQVQNFGEPFFLVIHEGETLAEIKVRIQKKLQVPEEEFSKVQSLLYTCSPQHKFILIHFNNCWTYSSCILRLFLV